MLSVFSLTTVGMVLKVINFQLRNIFNVGTKSSGYCFIIYK